MPEIIREELRALATALDLWAGLNKALSEANLELIIEDDTLYVEDETGARLGYLGYGECAELCLTTD